ncbi:MAG: hypothetical protein KBS65_00045 [Prevotella sp.]|nr:hypothetical protein [Candidatus Equicola stercoris]
MENVRINTNNINEPIEMLNCYGDDDANLYFHELGVEDNIRDAEAELEVDQILLGLKTEDEDDDYDDYDEDDDYDNHIQESYEDEDDYDYSQDGCLEGYSCYNCPNLGCPANAWN